MVVAGDPTGKTGYTVYALSLQGGSLTLLSQLDVDSGDTLPQLGINFLFLVSTNGNLLCVHVGMTAVEPTGLSAVMAGYNATGFGKLTLFSYY